MKISLKLASVIFFCFTICFARVFVVEKQISKNTEGLVFYDSIGAIESIFPEPNTMKVYAGDLDGFIHLLDGQNRKCLRVIKRKKVANGYCTGIAVTTKNELYIGVSDGIGNWGKQKCHIVRADSEINVTDTVVGPEVLINGMTIDQEDNLYFATGEFAFFFPKAGTIQKLTNTSSLQKPQIIVGDCKRPNGLFFDSRTGLLYFTKTLSGVFTFNSETKQVKQVIENKKLVDANDDLCKDKSGGLWIANPPGGFIKYYQPEKEEVVYFKSKDFGAASSCRIRCENGEEILYISEIRNPDGEYKGRGIISIPLSVLKGI